MKRRNFFAVLASATLAPSFTEAKIEESKVQNTGPLSVQALPPERVDEIYSWSNQRHDGVQLELLDSSVSVYLHVAYQALQTIKRAGLTPKQEFLDQIARAKQVRKQECPVTIPVYYDLYQARTGEPYFPPNLRAILASKMKKNNAGFLIKGYDFRPVYELAVTRTEKGHVVDLPKGVEARIIWSNTAHTHALTLSQTWQFERDNKMVKYGYGFGHEGPYFKLVEYTTSDLMGGTRTVVV
jgi:hypothetical protein